MGTYIDIYLHEINQRGFSSQISLDRPLIDDERWQKCE
jgi:hypothetical protein